MSKSLVAALLALFTGIAVVAVTRPPVHGLGQPLPSGPLAVRSVPSPSPVVVTTPVPTPVDHPLPAGVRWGCGPLHVVASDDQLLDAIGFVEHATGLQMVLDDDSSDEADAPVPQPPYDPAVFGHRWAPLRLYRTSSPPYVDVTTQGAVAVTAVVRLPEESVDEDVRRLFTVFGLDVPKALLQDEGYRDDAAAELVPQAAAVARDCPTVPPAPQAAVEGDPFELDVLVRPRVAVREPGLLALDPYETYGQEPHPLGDYPLDYYKDNVTTRDLGTLPDGPDGYPACAAAALPGTGVVCREVVTPDGPVLLTLAAVPTHEHTPQPGHEARIWGRRETGGWGAIWSSGTTPDVHSTGYAYGGAAAVEVVPLAGTGQSLLLFTDTSCGSQCFGPDTLVSVGTGLTLRPVSERPEVLPDGTFALVETSNRSDAHCCASVLDVHVTRLAWDVAARGFRVTGSSVVMSSPGGRLVGEPFAELVR